VYLPENSKKCDKNETDPPLTQFGSWWIQELALSRVKKDNIIKKQSSII
jgi:hypothetical protein